MTRLFMNRLSRFNMPHAVMAGGLVAFCAWATQSVAEPASGDAGRYVRYGFTIENTRNVTATNVVFFVQLPVYQSESQRTLECKVVPEAEILRDEAGNQVARIEFPEIPALATRLVEVEARLMLGTNAGAGLSVENPNRYLQPEEFVESDNEDIQALAKKAPKGTEAEVARWFEDEISKTIQPVATDPADRGALWALTNSKGDCTEQSYLFVALCRARGIPARVLGGYRCDGPCLLLPVSYHNWAEFHDGKSWIRVDLTPDSATPEYVAMKIHTPEPDARTGFFHRAKLVAGEGVEAKMNGLR